MSLCAPGTSTQKRGAKSTLESTSFPLKKSDLYGASLCDDHGDRKSLDELLGKLLSAKPKGSRKKCVAVNPKYRQLSIEKFYPTSPKSEVPVANKSPVVVAKTAVKNSKNKKQTRSTKSVVCNKITSSNESKTNSAAKLVEMFSKNNKAIKNCQPVENAGKKTVLTENTSSGDKRNKCSVKKSKRSLKRQSSGSFAKYGVTLPTFEDILEYKKKIKTREKCDDDLDLMEDSQESFHFNFEESDVPGVILDCKHLKEQEINEAFQRNYKYVCDIFHGKRYSERHERFKKENYKDQFTTKDLRYSTSTSAFTLDQKQQLLSKLREKLDIGKELFSNSQYYLKVLLPELCMKIFMDVHSMNREEAVAYLEEKPIKH